MTIHIEVSKAFLFKTYEQDMVTHIAHDGKKVLACCDLIHLVTDKEVMDCPVAKNWVLIRKPSESVPTNDYPFINAIEGALDHARTSAERYFEQRMQEPEYAAAYHAERARLAEPPTE